MKKVSMLAVLLLTIISFSGAVEKINSLLGTWIVGDAGLVLTFSGKDSISVTSVTDSSVKGNGTYIKSDSTFSTTINNNDIIMKMQYRFRWKTKDSIEAQAILFTVNGDTVDSPKEWAVMARQAKGQKADQVTTKSGPSEKKTK
jgi:hypothetical protein